MQVSGHAVWMVLENEALGTIWMVLEDELGTLWMVLTSLLEAFGLEFLCFSLESPLCFFSS